MLRRTAGGVPPNHLKERSLQNDDEKTNFSLGGGQDYTADPPRGGVGMRALNPMNPKNMGTIPAEKLYTQEEVDNLIVGLKSVATDSTNGLMSADDKKKLDALSSGVDKAVASAAVTIPTSKAASSSTITFDAECDYINCNDYVVANGGNAQWKINISITSGTYEYRSITVTLTSAKTVTVTWSGLSSDMKNSIIYNIVGYKYLI